MITSSESGPVRHQPTPTAHRGRRIFASLRLVVFALLALVIVATTVAPDADAQATPTCNGLAVTIDMRFNGGNGTGTAGDDVILGTPNVDTINGLAGNDTICSGGDNDVIDGGPGIDRIFGASGDDVIRGGADDDVLHGGLGADELYGDDGDDRIFGYADADLIRGGDGNDRLHGNFGNDDIDGGPGDDRMFGYGDDDMMIGGPGDDLMGGNFGNDVIDGGEGHDTIYGSNGLDIVRGGPGNDSVEGNSSDDQVFGGDGNDQLDGGIDNDLCDGGFGVDTARRCEIETNLDTSPMPDRITIIRGNNQSGSPTAVLATPLSVLVTDQNGTPLSGVDVAFRVASGGGSTSPAATTTNAVGEASSTWTLGQPAGTQTVVAEIVADPSLSTTFTATANVPAACQQPTRGGGFHEDLAKEMFLMSSRAYEDGENPLTGDCWNRLRVLDDSGTGTQATIFRNQYTSDLVVAFRGTEFTSEIVDIATDANIDKVSFTHNGTTYSESVHEGFKDGYMSVRADLNSILDDYAAPEIDGARVYFTGHSLGGALATLASLDQVEGLVGDGYNRNDIIMYSFGAPRSMTTKLDEIYASAVPTSAAIANAEDPVPHLPSASGSSNEYVHIPRMVILTETDNRHFWDIGPGDRFTACANLEFTLTQILAREIAEVFTHFRPEYEQRLFSGFTGEAPEAWLTVVASEAKIRVLNEGRFELNWSGSVGPCDRVAIVAAGGNTILPMKNLVPSWEWATDSRLGGRNAQWTGYAKGDDYAAAYINVFGEIVDRTTYFPSTPTTLSLEGGGFIEMEWRIPDPGRHDFVAVYYDEPTDADDLPSRACVTCYEDAIDGPTQVTSEFDGFGSRTYWIAYIQEDEDGDRRILRKERFSI